MKTLLLLFLIALVLTGLAAWLVREPEHDSLTCLLVQQHVNSIYERSYRGETELTPDAVRELQWLERSLCGHPSALYAQPASTPSASTLPSPPGGIQYQADDHRQLWRFTQAGVTVGLDNRTGWWMATDRPHHVDAYIEGNCEWVDGQLREPRR